VRLATEQILIKVPTNRVSAHRREETETTKIFILSVFYIFHEIVN